MPHSLGLYPTVEIDADPSAETDCQCEKNGSPMLIQDTILQLVVLQAHAAQKDRKTHLTLSCLSPLDYFPLPFLAGPALFATRMPPTFCAGLMTPLFTFTLQPPSRLQLSAIVSLSDLSLSGATGTPAKPCF